MIETNKLYYKKVELVESLFSSYFPKITSVQEAIGENEFIQKSRAINYLDKLIKQYLETQGIESKYINYDEFLSWLIDYMKSTNEYSLYEEEYGFNLNDLNLAEVYKGRLDSIVLNPATIVSPYAVTFGINSSFLFEQDNKTYISTIDKIVEPKKIKIQTFITHNPYEHSLIHNWDRMHNIEEFNIAIGVYGNINDKNVDDKIKMLKMLKEKIKDCQLYSDTLGEQYFGILVAKNKRLVKDY